MNKIGGIIAANSSKQAQHADHADGKNAYNSNHHHGAEAGGPGKNDQIQVKVSTSTKEKIEAAKAYIENKYSKKKEDEKVKKEFWDELNKKMDDMNLTEPERDNFKHNIIHKEAERQRQKRKKLEAKNFLPVAIIGRGAFGEVRLCKWKESDDIVAVKKMKKSEMIYKNQVTHIRAERDVLAHADNPWIVSLECSFQDEKYLYLVMEYLAGGDLMTLLMKKDILSETESKFYIAELILAVESVHKMNYIHRDLKPDNILIDNRGHIKLSDFGLCKHADLGGNGIPAYRKLAEGGSNGDHKGDQYSQGKKIQFKQRNRKLAFSTVGTPDYIAPEVFIQNGYSETVDWWSVGVILFEMLVGYPPFFSEDPSVTCQKILHWRKTLVIPPEANLSIEANDLLRRLIADAGDRLGVNGVEEIKAHPFFAGVDWKRIRERRSPYIPELKNELDTCNFDHYEEEEPWICEEKPKTSSGANGGLQKSRKEVQFIGYTFKRDFEHDRSSMVTALEELEMLRTSHARRPQTAYTQPSVQEPAPKPIIPQKETANHQQASQIQPSTHNSASSNPNHMNKSQIIMPSNDLDLIRPSTSNMQSKAAALAFEPPISSGNKRESFPLTKPTKIVPNNYIGQNPLPSNREGQPPSCLRAEKMTLGTTKQINSTMNTSSNEGHNPITLSPNERKHYIQPGFSQQTSQPANQPGFLGRVGQSSNPVSSVIQSQLKSRDPQINPTASTKNKKENLETPVASTFSAANQAVLRSKLYPTENQGASSQIAPPPTKNVTPSSATGASRTLEKTILTPHLNSGTRPSNIITSTGGANQNNTATIASNSSKMKGVPKYLLD